MITIVSGLPRSGTSLVMQMLVASGFPVLYNKEPNCDAQNPRGYYEWENQKSLWQSSGRTQTALFARAQGKAVKIFPQCFPCLSPAFEYQIIYVDRRLEEVISSQRKMLSDLGRNPDEVKREELEKLRFHAMIYCAYFRLLFLNHNDLYNGEAARAIELFLRNSRDEDMHHTTPLVSNSRVIAMETCVDPGLRHQAW